jgi:chromosome segregation ATPase
VAGALTQVLRILIDSNSAGAQADMKRLGLTASETMSKLDKLKSAAMVGAGVGVGVEAVGGAVSALKATAGFVINQARAAVDQASQLEQAQASVEAVFQSSSRSVEQFASTAATNLGLSKAAVFQNVAAVGSLLQNLGYTQAVAAETSQKLVTIASDLGAAFGRSTEEAMQGLTALLRGEFDTIEKFGIKIKEIDIQARAQAMGLDMSTVAAKNNSTAIAALSLATEQAAKFQGSFAERSDTLLGQQQRLRAEWANIQAEIGARLLPALSEITKSMREALPVIAETASNIAELTAAWIKLSNATAKGLKWAITGPEFEQPFVATEKNLKKLEIWTYTLPDALAQGLNSYLANLNAAVSYTAEQITKLNTDAVNTAAGLRDEVFGAFTVQNSFRNSIAQTGGTASDTASKVERAYRRIEDAQRSVADAQAELQEAQVALFLTSLGPTADEVAEAQINERNATRALTQSKRDLAQALSDLNALREVDKAGVMDAEAAYIQAQRDVVAAEREGDKVKLLKANADLIRTQKAYNQSLDPTTSDEYGLAQERVAAAQDGVLQAEINLRDTRQELVDVTNRGKEGSKELAEANKAVEEASRKVESAQRDLVEAQDSLNDATSRVAGSQKSVNDQLIAGVSAADGWVQYLIKNKRPVSEFNDAIAEIYKSLKDVADRAGMTSDLDTWISKASEAYGLVKNLQNLPTAPGGFSSDPMNAFTSVPDTKVVMQIDGRSFGEVVVTGLLAYQNSNGPIPIKVR